MERMTYKSMFGDYGCAVDFQDPWDIMHDLWNRLGAYEDLGLTPEEIRERLGLGK